MLVDRYTSEDVFARVPEMAQLTDLVLKELDSLLEFLWISDAKKALR